MPPTVSKFRRLSARLRGTAADEIPVPFEVRCDCGCQVDGTRSPSPQQVNCPECHTTLFVLPANVYPATDSVVSDVIGGSLGHRLRVVVGEALPQRKAKPATSAPPPTAEQTDDETSPSAQPVVKRRRLPRLTLPTINPAQLVRRAVTPIRLLVLGMVLVIGGTSYWVYEQNQQDAARQTWHRSTDELPELLAGDDFEALQETLVAATAAGARIGQHGPEWRRIRNLLRETKAVTSVSYETLTELLTELAARPAGAGQDISSLQAAMQQGIFVVDGYLDPSGSNDSEYSVDVPAMADESPVLVTLRLPALAEYMLQNPSRRLVCAFQIAGVEETDRTIAANGWQVHVDSGSFVLMTSHDHCRQLGFSVESDPSLVEVLDSQRIFVEESEDWERHPDESDQDQRMASRDE